MAENDSGRPQGYWRVPELFPDLNPEVLERLESYYSELVKFNQKLNLISRRSELDADVTHIADCVIGGRILLEASKSSTIYDVGSGNGLPGMILGILAPERKFVLVDSDMRKVEFLKIAISRMGMANVIAVRGRFEDLEEGSIPCAVSRGFANISKTILLARKPFSVGGEYFHFKG